MNTSMKRSVADSILSAEPNNAIAKVTLKLPTFSTLSAASTVSGKDSER
ncbi:MAG: hypothetical protein VX990_07755 [Pseudomonadota bacterium]|nr:hypothetical protein [Pseudomonadota bacterium]